MAKVALLIGVSEYGSGLNPLPGAVRDVEAVQQVLQPLEMGGFDEVKLLPNPNPPVMREAIETLFSGRTKDDLVLLFFSGHVVQDDSGKLYFSTSITCKSPKADLIGVSAISASFVHELMSNSPCQRQVVILDCCVSGASVQEMMANDDGTVDIKTQLGGEGRAILASFTFSENSFDSEGSHHSVYTRYLIEGIRTGAADLDGDGWISVDELHEYASNRVQAVAPAVKPTFYRVEDRYKILLLVAPVDDPKLKYRKEAERWVSRGEISRAGRYSLNKLAERLQLTVEDCSVIEAEVLQPYQEYQEKLERYKREFAQAIANNYPLATQERENLRDLQQSLALRDEDVAPIEERMAFQLAALSQFEDNADELVQSDAESELNSLPSTPSAVLSK
ncbi:MAG: caspase family protein, partial [Coleofasciculus sp. C3-bin4]|nr:caspase family protein [Coleofasciculus sp. C3-bin4]